MKFLKLKNENVILLIWFAFFVIQAVLYITNFKGQLSPDSSVWANFSTFFSLSFSFISAIFIFLTYRSQTNMSSVLEFESIFFQWHQQHREIYNNLVPQITNFSSNVAMKFIRQHKGVFTLEDFRNSYDESKHRDVIRYYRSLYHLMKYIHLNPILHKEEQKKKYFDIIQAMITDEELNTVLYLLLADEWLNDKRVLKTCSLLELVDKYHLFKNFYYSNNEENYNDFVLFMHEHFIETKKSFHFLIDNFSQIEQV